MIRIFQLRLVLAVSWGAMLVSTGMAEDWTPIQVNIHYGRLAELDDGVRESMFAELDSIYQPGGIRFQKANAEVGEPLVRVVFALRPRASIITGCRRNLHDHRLGVTNFSTRRLTLWTGQIERAVVGDWDRRQLPPVANELLGKAMGRVLAHELGHFFLRLGGHESNGLMRASFSHRSLRSKNGGSFRLSKENLLSIRQAIDLLRGS